MKRFKRLLATSFAAVGMLSLCNCTCASCNSGAHASPGAKGAAGNTTGTACCAGGACCTAKKS